MKQLVLVCVTGELGIGKTLVLSYLAWNNWYFKKRIIATNYTIYGIPHFRIKTVDQFFKFIPEKETEEEILKGEEKWFGGDDFWRWISAKTIGLGAKKKNEIIQRILMASRKAFVTVNYTTQLFGLIPREIREITDLLMKPILSPDHSYCKVFVYGIIEGKVLQPMQPFYFNTEPIYSIFNTYERAGEILMADTDFEPVIMQNSNNIKLVDFEMPELMKGIAPVIKVKIKNSADVSDSACISLKMPFGWKMEENSIVELKPEEEMTVELKPVVDMEKNLIPIEQNPAWKKYCRDFLEILVDSPEFLGKCTETMEGLKRGLP